MSPRRPQPRSCGSKKAAGIEWIGGTVAMPAYVTGEGEPYRPEALFWMGADGAILGSTSAVAPTSVSLVVKRFFLGSGSKLPSPKSAEPAHSRTRRCVWNDQNSRRDRPRPNSTHCGLCPQAGRSRACDTPNSNQVLEGRREVFWALRSGVACGVPFSSRCQRHHVTRYLLAFLTENELNLDVPSGERVGLAERMGSHS